MPQAPAARAGRAAAEQAAAAALVWTVIAAGRPPASLGLDPRFLAAGALGVVVLAAVVARASRRASDAPPGAANAVALASLLVSFAVLAVPGLLARAPGAGPAEALATALAGAIVASAAAWVLASRRAAALALARLAGEKARAIEQAKADWERTFDAIPSVLYLLDGEGRLVRANRAASTFLGRGFPELIGKTADELGLPAGVREAPAVIPLGAAPGRLFRHVGYPGPEGRDASIHVLEDVTGAEELRQRAVSAERQAALGELVARVAHEVRNPLFGIAAATRVLRESASGGEDVAPALEHVERETRRLTALMEELLDLRRPAARLRTPRPLDRLVREACASARLRYPDRALSIEEELAPVPEIEVDELRVAQVLGNLLDNAVLSSPEVTVRVRSRAEADAVIVEIDDSGPGLTEEARRRAFEPFFSTRPGGSGLGLKIAKETMEEHGGTIALSPSAAGGALVTLRFPRGR